jgi:hypothetical protein
MRIQSACQLAVITMASIFAACGAPSLVTDASPRDSGGAMDAQNNDVPSSDSQSIDVPSSSDVSRDTAATDVPTGDTVTSDRPNADSGSTCGAGAACRAYWCGCGRCNPAEITCVSDGRECLLDCVGTCPELETTVCRCVGNSCQVANTPSDAGRDASNGLPRDSLCGDGIGDCAPGLLCCYPCGIPGCMNRCTEPMNGRCPLVP